MNRVPAVTNPRHVLGVGIRTRHSRSCRAPRNGFDCPCRPSFEAWVYVTAQRKKRRRTFYSLSEARRWRLDTLRRMYGDRPPAKPGRLDEGYSHIRRAAQEFDRALALVEPPLRAHVRETLEALYAAEDAALRTLLTG
jgi:hypothetical protein